jgi:hypothetical protein
MDTNLIKTSNPRDKDAVGELSHVVQRLLDDGRVLRSIYGVGFAVGSSWQRPLRKSLHRYSANSLKLSSKKDGVASPDAQGARTRS